MHFNVTTDNAALFSSAPSIDASGTLRYTLASGALGSATVTVTAQDDGGTANGDQDTSAAQTFLITASDTLNGTAGPDTLTGTAGPDTLTGTAAPTSSMALPARMC